MSPEKIQETFRAFNDLNVLIIGDVMVDAYYWGKIERISPEAPVPIVAVNKKESRMGGAANVALNILAMGATPLLCSVIGSDEKGKLFQQLMDKRGMDTKGLVESKARVTTTKTRVIGSSQHILRVDEEDEHPLNSIEQNELLNRIKGFLEKGNIDIIIFEDYDKGAITPELISAVVALANTHEIPTAVDPKKRNFLAYNGVTLFKPNLKELKEGTASLLDLQNLDAISSALSDLVKQLNAQQALVTLSEKGVMIGNAERQDHFPAHIRSIADVSGAGDTVIGVASLCLALNLPSTTLAQWANLAGGLVCESVGVVPIQKEQLLKEVLSLHASAPD